MGGPITVWCNQMGTVGKLTLFKRIKLINLWSHINSEKSCSSVFVSSKSYFMVMTWLNVWFISCRLMKSVSFQTVPIWLHHSVYWFTWPNTVYRVVCPNFGHPARTSSQIFDIVRRKIVFQQLFFVSFDIVSTFKRLFIIFVACL